jgi:transcription initiation factor TFIIA small subunit
MTSETQYTLYRNSTIGNELENSLDELQNEGKITNELREDILSQFDKSVTEALNTVKSKCSFKVLLY